MLPTAVVHGLALIGLMVLLVVVVPRYEETYRNAPMCLPQLTVALINTSRFAMNYYFLLLPVVLAADVGVYALLRSCTSARILSTVWSVVVLLGVLLCAGLIILATQLPFAAMAEQVG